MSTQRPLDQMRQTYNSYAMHDSSIKLIAFLCNRALQMLAAIESRLEELFETIESLSPEKVEAAEKVQHNHCRLYRIALSQAHSQFSLKSWEWAWGLECTWCCS